MIPLIQEGILIGISEKTNNIKLGAILATVILFFFPSMLMGILTPVIVKLKLDSLNTAGKVAGKITAIATIGGIFGTFLGGFFLIPSYRKCTNIICIVNINCVINSYGGF